MNASNVYNVTLIFVCQSCSQLNELILNILEKDLEIKCEKCNTILHPTLAPTCIPNGTEH
jgi:DNA-directed RNA polymerase subunit RPC12/RpoP